ncbi:class I SAM-dependent methyltransferase [Alkaliphilus serpentinus]|uniref:Class I SAM-dependent methyltransferase n=1 Tax=Alkaliphilus serpentinus TaxID=1482731 RepID=A0A833HP98_9FIRM|nr:class I SAM-dependent methyltransferase [Alkaliphilus serpentinus]KAB3530464.1 class I SAM-dependent methyltransferase [Alkaliphilus serpentinus]
MYKIVTAEKFLWEGLNLDGKQVLEGGTSWGNTIDLIASKVRENGWKTNLISVDIDDSHFNEIENRVKGTFQDLSLRKADLSDLSFVSSETIDIIICNYTLASVNQFPLRAIKVLKEFYRVLKVGGKLLITEEMPIWSVDSNEYEYWSKRLRIIKSISVLKAMAYFNEIHPKDLEEALTIVGFNHLQWQEFKEKIDAELATRFLDKRKQTLIKGRDDIHNQQLTNGFVEVTEKLIKEFENAKEFSAPAYIMKCIK